MFNSKSVKLLALTFMCWSVLNIVGEFIILKTGLAYDSSGLISVIWWLITLFTFPVWIGREFLQSFFDMPGNVETLIAYVIANIFIWSVFVIFLRLFRRKTGQ